MTMRNMGVGIVFILLTMGAYFVGRNQESLLKPQDDTKETLQVKSTSTLSLSEGLKKLHAEYYYLFPEFVYGNKLWYTFARETEGCDQVNNLDLDTGQKTETSLSACPEIPLSVSLPFYIENDDFKNVHVLNLVTGEDKIVHTITNPEETTIQKCFFGNYDLECYSSMQLRGTTLEIGVYKAIPRGPTEEYENKTVRVDTIDLKKVFNVPGDYIKKVEYFEY